MAFKLSMVMLREDTPLSVTEIQRQLATKWPDLPAPRGTEADGDTIIFGLAAFQVILGKIDAPIPWGDLEQPCETSIFWKNAADEVRQHNVHWIVTVMGELDAVAQTTLLSQVTAAVMASCPSVMGVYFGDASLVIPRDIYIELAEEYLPSELPLPLWVDFRVGTDSETTSAGFTVGMVALGHMELETKGSSDPPGKLRERMMSLAGYLIENGPVIKNGHTIGADEEERIRVVYAKSAFGHEGKVMRLEYGDAASKKPWWKPW